MNKKGKVYLGILLIMTLLLVTCESDCPVEEPLPACYVKNATITQFIPGMTIEHATSSLGQDSVYYKPIANFAIETFEFPLDNSSSGSQPYDQRFETGFMPVAEEQFTSGSSTYYAIVAKAQPSNEDMLGDIMVVDVTIDAVNPLSSTATLRFYGNVCKCSNDFMSDNSGDFCETFIPQNTNRADFLANATQFGANLNDDTGNNVPGANVVSSYTAADIAVLNANRVWLDPTDPSTPAVPADVETRILAAAQKKHCVDITVSPGLVYYVKARNGREFIMVVTKISQSDFPLDNPKKKRVSIMFNPIR